MTSDGKFVEAFMDTCGGHGSDDSCPVLNIMTVGTERLLGEKAFEAVRKHYPDDAWRPMEYMEFNAGCLVGAGLELCYREPRLTVVTTGGAKILIDAQCPHWRDYESVSESCTLAAIRGEVHSAWVSRETGVLLVVVGYPGSGRCFGGHDEYHAVPAPALRLR